MVTSVAAGSLRSQHYEACEASADLAEELAKVREEQQALLLHLRARGIRDATVIPKTMCAGEQPEDCLNELRDLIAWVAERVDMSQEVVFNVGGAVQVGKDSVYLGRYVRWELHNSGGQRLSVPYEMRAQVARLLAKVHATRGRAAALENELDTEDLSRHWDMVTAEISTGGKTSVPAVFLVHSLTRRAMVVGAWPTTKADKEQKNALPIFDPSKHFRRPLAKVVPRRSIKKEPVRDTRADDTAKERPKVTGSSMGTKCKCSKSSTFTMRRAVAVGDRVEIKYQGQWFAGVLQRVAGDVANVQCDVDVPGLITVAPLANVRLTQLIPVPSTLTSIEYSCATRE